MMVQASADASPAKWHLAHTTWFFETFLLREFVPGYLPFHPDYIWLFNSYYNAVSAQPEKKLRASFSRPTVEEILAYRRHVDAAMEDLAAGAIPEEARTRIVLGLNHEQQHQELLLTDVKHALYTNPLQPAYLDEDMEEEGLYTEAEPLHFPEFAGGLVEIGQTGDEEFGFDNERPRHKVWLEPFQLASRLVTCGEFAAFMEDGGYERPELWLSAGWDTVRAQGWRAPLYWSKSAGEWAIGTLRGNGKLRDLAGSPVTHVSYFEADAYAHWAGKRLATEAEWESVAATAPVEGNLLESGRLMPVAAKAGVKTGLGKQFPAQLFGDCWEWTSSAYLGYPGFQPLAGSLGEYNGKFMSGQMVLRGGSCVTPQRHIRASYRNFFPPETRWQFSGIRLAG
jgi:ergothioneine biosynthesis protein EgtB